MVAEKALAGNPRQLLLAAIGAPEFDPAGWVTAVRGHRRLSPSSELAEGAEWFQATERNTGGNPSNSLTVSAVREKNFFRR